MKIAVTYTELWRRTVDVDLDDDDLAAWKGDDSPPTTSEISDYLESEYIPWALAERPGSVELDEFDHLRVEDVEIPTAAELAAQS